MKLTAFLRKILPLMMAVTVVTVGSFNSYAANMNSDVSIITYTDFGQNMGWYKTNDASNALLTYLRNQAGGVTILRADGTVYTMPHEMIDFTGTSDNGAFMALGYNATVSVQHNGVFDGSFTSAYVGSENAVYYQGIEYRIDNTETFLHSAGGGYDGRGHDYKVTRMSKLITDVVPATLYSGSSTRLAEEAAGALLYHAGAGTMGVYTDNGESRTHSSLTGAYDYIIGGVDFIDSSVTYYEEDGTCTGLNKVTTGYTGSIDEPLPFEPQQGDSGSPVFIYNSATGQYEYIAAVQSIGAGSTNYLGGVDYTKNVLDSYSKVVDTAASELHLGAVETAGEAVSSNAAYNYGMEQLVSTTPYSGNVTDASGNVLQSFVGVKSGVNTWLDLSAVKDDANWYHYDNTYLNAAPYLDGTHVTDGKELSYADLFMTENLVFRSSAAQTSVVLDATVDLGIGYAQFSLAEGQANAVYNISSGGEGAYQFNHAGYVVDAGVSVHSTLTGSSSHMYEWRKVGAGELYIEGSGNNNVLLNLGGSGKTYLMREGGYAAYNVLANTYTTVVINDINQIARDFTFGHQGGVLDMNGNSMQWNNDNAAAAEGFTIHALDELAVVANLKSGSTTTLTWTQGGQQTFLGSFADNGKDSALQFVYDGGAGARLDLHSIKTHLTATGSGMEVNSGTLALSGTNTVHGLGSESGKNANRYSNVLDWHYADAAADVTVNDGATFELGSHARLTGDVTVAGGGTFIMREGVQHAQEYAEGSPMLVNTAAIADFYGLKGNVSLASGATMQVAYGAGVTANNIYSGSISGEGSVSVNLGSVASMFTLAGNNTFTGAKNLTQGVLVASTTAALGDTTANKWILGKQGTLVVLSGLTADNALSYVDGSSTGTLALHENMAGVLDMSNHSDLFVGAVAGKVVEYGTAESTLGSVGGKWNLGGGGGELVVNALLNDASAALVLGNGQGLGGIVTLTNSNNNIGSITFNEGVTLSFENAAALGGANIDLSYAASLLGSADTAAMLQLVNASSSGSVLLDRTGNADVNLSTHGSLSLGSAGDTTYSGNITVAENAAYRFGGGSGTLTLTNALRANGANNLVVDGQTQSGGKLVLAATSDLTGAISVMGYDSAKTSSQQGDMTLAFTVDNALASASSLTVHDGGIVDLGTTTQTFTNVQVLEGGVITGAEGSTLVFHMTEEKFQYGSLQLANAEKTGSANLVLAASGNSWDLLTIKQGTVFTRADNALSATGITRVENGGVLNMNTWNGDGFRSRTMNGNVLLADGGKIVSGTGTYDIYFNGSLDVESGATGTVEGGYWHLSAAQTNMSGGTLSFNSSQLHLAPTYAQHFGGTVDIAASSTTIYSEGAAEDMLKHFNHINIASGKALTLEDSTWNTIWQLDKLSGAGSLTWNSDTTHNKSARLIIGGDGEYSGVINFNRNHDASARTHQAFLEINGQKAASGATLNMTGAQNSYASLALNAERVELGGINGNGYSHIMAGAAPVDSASTSAPASTRNSTLVLTGSGDYTYSGSIGSAADSAAAGVSIQMSGSGTQTFNGANLYINDVSATSGTLNISSSSLHLNGDVYLSQGANLSIGNTFTLGSGTTLHVVDSSATGAANFNSQLILGGGTLNFDALGLSTDTPMLDLLNVSKVQYANGTSNLVISLSNTSNLYVDNSNWASSSTYKLSYDDWSSIDASSITLADMPHLNATFITSADGLSVQLSIPSTSNIWAGTSSSFDWTPGMFGGAFAAVTGTAVFDDSTNAYKIVKIASSSSGNAVKPENIIFDSTLVYTVDATGNATLTAKNLIQRGSGSTRLLGAVTVTDSVNIAYGTLVTTEVAQLAGSISGAGTLGIDWGEGVSGALNISHIGTLQLMSGVYNLNAGSAADNIVVDFGATLNLADGVALNTQLSTSGTLVMGSGSSLAGSFTLSGATEVNVSNGSGDVQALINGAGQSLTKNGAGTLVLSNSSVALGQLNVAEGGVQIGTDIGSGISEISLAGGSFLKFNWGGGLADTKVLMAEGSSLLVVNGGVGTVRPDVVLTGANAVLQGGYYNPSCTLGGSISAAAGVSSTLKLTNDESHAWTISSTIADGEGTVAVSVENAGTAGDKNSAPNVKITGNNTYSGGTTIKDGTLTAAGTNALGTGNVKIAGGTLTLAQDLTISSLSGGEAGTLNLNGKTLTVGNGAVTFAARAADSTSTYYGAVGSSGSITKVGSDTQVFASADMQLENVSVQGGTLSLKDVASVSGDIYVASGATLVTGGDAISLGAGQTLTAQAGASVTLAGLSLDGGTLSLDLGMPTGAPEETPSLSLAAAVGSGGVVTLVGDLSSLQTAQLMLAKGDWSHFANGGLSLDALSLLSGGSTPLSYSLMANSEGLYLSFAAVSDADSNIWAGTAEAHEWNADSFSVYGTGALAEKAIFNETAAHKTVTLSGSVSTGAVEIVGGGYSFEGSGSIAAGSVSAVGGGASTISNISLSSTEDGTIRVDGSELTIVELSPTNPSAPIALSNAAKLTIGDASHRYGAFSGKVTGDAGSQLHLYTRLSTETDYWKGNDTIQLLADSTVQDVYIHGDLALNQASGYGDAVTQLQNANVHFDDNAFISIRQNTGEYAPSGGDIVLHGILNLIVYQPLTETGTIIAGDFVEAEGSTSKLVKYANQDPGNLTLSGNIAVDAIEVQAGTLQLTGSCTSTTVYTVNSGATLALSGSSVYSFDASSVRTINGTLKIDSDVNVSGAGRITIAPSGKIELADGASLIRPEGNIGAYWIQGDLVALENATADFSTVDDVHFYEQAGGQIKTERGATLNLTSKSLQYWKAASIELDDDSVLNLTTTGTDGVKHSGDDASAGLALTLGEGAALNVLDGNVNLNAHSSLVLGSNAKVNFNGDNVTFDSGATLTMGTGSDLKVSSGTMKIQSDIGSADTSSTVTLAGGHLQLNYNGEQSVHSKLSVNNSAATAQAPVTSVLRNDTGAESLVRNLASVEIAANNTLELQQASWNTIWNIKDLNGEGDLLWSSTTNHSSTSRLILSGDGSDFFGNVTVNRSYDAANRRYQAFVEIASDNALQNSVLTFNCTSTGTKANAITSVAINTANAQVAGVQSDAYAHLYAGASVVASGSNMPSSSAANTLTIAGAGDYTFAGTVGTSADAARLSLAMTGEGKQTFSGQAYVGNVSVSKGELVLSQADVDGSVTVSGGALNMTGSAYTLGSGDVLSVLTGTEHAVQLGNLTLSGGEMVFDASLLNADTSALSVGTVSLAEGTSSQLITFNNIDNLESGRYLLSDGWTAVDGLSFTTNTLSQGVASVVMQEGALYLVYNNDGVYTWVGGAEVDGAADTNWSSANWDIVPDTDATNNLSFAAGKDAIFNSSATAVVSDAVTAGTVYIMNGAKVTWKMEGEGASLSFAHVDVVNGELSLGQQTNWTGMAEISVRKDGALVLSWGTGLAADKLLLQGGTIELYNGSGTYHELNTAITVDGSGRIKGSSNGNSTVLKGSITGTGTLYFEKIHDNPIEIESTMTDGAEGALSVNIGNAYIVYDGAKRYTGGTTIGDGGMLTLNSGGQEGGMVGSVDVYGTLKLNAGDATGWGSSANTISAINLYEGGVLNVTVTDNQTGSGIAINLQGGVMTGVANSNFDLAYGGSSRGHSTITALAATGATADNPTVSSIDTVSISLRQNTTVIEVQENAQLNISSSIKQKNNDTINGETAGDYTFTKTGLGELVLSGQNTYTGTTSITGGTLELAGAVSMAADGGAIDVASGATLLLNTTQTLSLNNDITSQGIIHKKSGEEVVLNGDVTASLVNVADGNHQTVHAGTLTFAGDTVKVGKLYLAYGSVNVGSTDGSATFMSLTQLEAGDSEEGNSTVSLTIRDGSTLSVTGNNSTGGASYKSASFLLAEWNASATLNVEGTLLVQNAKVLVGDDATVINISGGTMAVQGITHARGGYNTGLELNLTEGGKLILGASGINTDKPVTATFGEGTVGMSAASTTIAENVTLNSAEGTTFDTTQYAYKTNAEGVATDIERGDEGGDMVLSGDITSADGVAASMKVAGAGTLHVAGSADVRGNVTVEQGAGMAVSSATDGTAASMATISSADGSNAASISGGVRLSHADAAVSIVGSGMDITEISNSLIALQQGVSLNMNNLHIAAGTQVQGYHAATAASGVMLLDGEVTRNDVALADVSLEISKANAVRGADGANTQAAKVMMLSSSAFSYSSLTGTLTVEFSGEFAHELLAGGYDAVGLSFTETEFDTTAITILGMYEGISGSVEGYFDTSAGGNAVVYFSTDIIPEPATSTLGLLALAALAYRRRRK